MPTKICTSCDEKKWISDFHKDTSSKDGRRSQCKTCTLEKYRDNRRVNSHNSRERKREYVLKYLQEHACVDCGEDDPVVLEFDHIKDEKFNNISRLVVGGWGLDTVKREIEKCEIVCANCHRRRTAETYNHYRHLTDV